MTTATTRYKQDGITYICAGDATTPETDAMAAAREQLRVEEKLADDMERIDGCCTWTVVGGEVAR